MKTLDAIQLFKNEMINEILHNVSDTVLQDTLLDAVKNVETTVIETYNAENK